MDSELIAIEAFWSFRTLKNKMTFIFIFSNWVRNSAVKWVSANYQKTKQTEAHNFYCRLLFTDIKFPSQLGKLLVMYLIEFFFYYKVLITEYVQGGQNYSQKYCL